MVWPGFQILHSGYQWEIRGVMGNRNSIFSRLYRVEFNAIHRSIHMWLWVHRELLEVTVPSWETWHDQSVIEAVLHDWRFSLALCSLDLSDLKGYQAYQNATLCMLQFLNDWTIIPPFLNWTPNRSQHQAITASLISSVMPLKPDAIRSILVGGTIHIRRTHHRRSNIPLPWWHCSFQGLREREISQVTGEAEHCSSRIKTIRSILLVVEQQAEYTLFIIYHSSSGWPLYKLAKLILVKTSHWKSTTKSLNVMVYLSSIFSPECLSTGSKAREREISPSSVRWVWFNTNNVSYTYHLIRWCPMHVDSSERWASPTR